MTHPGFVYFIACKETGRLKIGHTKGAPAKRLKALQTGSPSPLVLMAYQPGSQDDERSLHAKFDKDRIGGEWFNMSEGLFQHVCFVTWMTARMAIKHDEPIEEWVRIGLRSMHEDIGDLPEDLAALIA